MPEAVTERQYEWVKLPNGRMRYQPVDVSAPRRGCGEYWRQHDHLALEVGANQVQQMDEHYRKHGILVGHRQKANGGYEPACTSKRDFDRCLAARGMVDKG